MNLTSTVHMNELTWAQWYSYLCVANKINTFACLFQFVWTNFEALENYFLYKFSASNSKNYYN